MSKYNTDNIFRIKTRELFFIKFFKNNILIPYIYQ